MISLAILDPGALSPLPRTAGGRGVWRVERPVRALIGGAEVVAPAGFITDGASSPWWARFPFDPWGRHGAPAVIHDYLRQTGDLPRWLTDWAFLGLLRAAGVPGWRAVATFLAVQLWRPRRPILEPET